MNYQDRLNKIKLKDLLPKLVAIFMALLLLVFIVGFFPGSVMIVLATLGVVILVLIQTIIILKDDSGLSS